MGVDYEPGDVLIMDGSKMHGVSALRQVVQGLSGQPLRFSCVHFTRVGERGGVGADEPEEPLREGTRSGRTYLGPTAPPHVSVTQCAVTG